MYKINDSSYVAAEIFEQPMSGDKECCYGVYWYGLKIYCSSVKAAKKLCGDINNLATAYTVE